MLGQRYIVMGEAKGGVMKMVDEYKLLPASGVYDADITYNNIRYSSNVKITGRVVQLPEAVDAKVIIEL